MGIYFKDTPAHAHARARKLGDSQGLKTIGTLLDIMGCFKYH